MDTQPSGYLPMKERPEPEDKLIFIPVYIAPVEILERSLMRGPRYVYQVVIVDGYSGKPTLVDKKTVAPDMDFMPENEEKEFLELKISPVLAKEIAEYGAVPADFQSWKKIIRNRNVSVSEGYMKVAWRVYAVRGKEILDTFSGERIESAGLAGMLFS
ncbi:MAG: hypothetical protein PHO18_04545 [Synergistaceae bacterium]|nr:hypothetical protein [Synergistaceae bacterium]